MPLRLRRPRAATAPTRSTEKDATVYWQSVVDMRRVRIAKRNRGEAIELTDYVLTQPPLWPGTLAAPPVCRPRRPACPGFRSSRTC